MTLIQTKQKRAGREQRNKYKPRTETSTKQEQKQEQHLTIRHAGRPADLVIRCDSNIPIFVAFCGFWRGLQMFQGMTLYQHTN